ncbi:MAG: choice-of-anchor Q domain-containing protein [Thermoanaerobaculia bacterium]
MRAPTFLLLAGITLAPASAPAETFCVGTSNELQGALIVASLNQESDTIRIRSGTYVTPSADGFLFQPASGSTAAEHDLVLSGGWSGACTRSSNDAYDTVLTANSAGPVMKLVLPTTEGWEVDVRNLTISGGDSPTGTGALEINGGSAFGPLVEIERVRFHFNSGWSALHIRTGFVFRILGCEFSSNLVSVTNGASAIVEQSQFNSAYILNNTFTQNDAVQQGFVGGIRLENPFASPTYLVNNVFWANDNVDLLVIGHAEPFSYNDYEVVSGSFGGTNNLQVDPGFRDAANYDYRLRADSPMRNSGDGTTANLPGRDLRGILRPQESLFDRGAFEFLPSIFADGFESGSVSAWDFSLP